jgi:HlyD family secretion protein
MKVLVGLFLVALVAGLLTVQYWHAGRDNRPQFRTQPVTRANLLIAVSATGTVEPVEVVDVGAQVVGCVRSFGPDPDRPGKTIDYCSRVRKDAVLAQMDDLPHRAELDKAQANVKLAEAELKRYLARREQARRDLERAKQLQASFSKGEYESVQAEDVIAQAELTMGEAKLELAKIVAKQAEINLDYTTIRSPVDGVVIDRRVNVGQTVVAGLNAPSLFLLARDLQRLQVWAAVNEADIGDIHIGQSVSFEVDAHRDRIFTGKVSQIRLNASLMQNVVTYGVVVDVDNTDGTLLPYMTAKLQFEVACREQVLLVPNQALRWRPAWDEVSLTARAGLTPPDPGKPGAAPDEELLAEGDVPRVEVQDPTVWVLAEDGFVRPVKVQVGLSDGIHSEVTGGELQPADPVVINVQHKAKPDFVSGFISKITKREK